MQQPTSSPEQANLLALPTRLTRARHHVHLTQRETASHQLSTCGYHLLISSPLSGRGISRRAGLV